MCYRVATISRLLKIIGPCCKRALQKRLHSAKETYNLKGPTDRSHPICRIIIILKRLLHTLDRMIVIFKSVF